MDDIENIGSWSQEKHKLLGKYLKAYCNILNSQKRKRLFCEYWYIDAFAGSVTARRKDTKAFVDGSPIIALKTEPAFDRYVFIDINNSRIKKRISRLHDDFPEKSDRIHIHRGNCNDILLDITPSFHKRYKRRGIVFLDPYAPNVRWKTVEALAKVGTLDVFINYPLMGLNRLLPKRTPPSIRNRQIVSDVLGCENWYEEAYGQDSWLRLMGDKRRIIRQVESIPWLTNFYVERLKYVFPHVSDVRIMYNSKNTPLYALILASHKQVATKIMNDIFKR
ncbi:MAG: three-Cys-motif partner protein TcmP [Desulfovibrionaceae bacterium]|nr:three-Cys-motif partner protein TcmP [Desulfovibrionaceae bacterium]